MFAVTSSEFKHQLSLS